MKFRPKGWSLHTFNKQVCNSLVYCWTERTVRRRNFFQFVIGHLNFMRQILQFPREKSSLKCWIFKERFSLHVDFWTELPLHDTWHNIKYTNTETNIPRICTVIYTTIRNGPLSRKRLARFCYCFQTLLLSSLTIWDEYILSGELYNWFVKCEI